MAKAGASPLVDVIQHELEQIGYPTSSREQAALADSVREESFRHRYAMLEDSLTAPQVANLLGTSRQTPLNRVAKGDLLAVYENGKHLFPVFQFDAAGPGGVVFGFVEVLRTLKISPIEKLNWLLRASPYLEGRTPVAALKQGDIGRVKSIARGIGEQ